MRRAVASVVVAGALAAGYLTSAAGAAPTSAARELRAAAEATLAVGVVHTESYTAGALTLEEDFRGPNQARARLHTDGGEGADVATILAVDGWRYFPDEDHDGKWVACPIEPSQAVATPGAFITSVALLPDAVAVKRTTRGTYEFHMPKAAPQGISSELWKTFAGTRGTAKVRDGLVTEVRQVLTPGGRKMVFLSKFAYDDVATTSAPPEGDVTSRDC